MRGTSTYARLMMEMYLKGMDCRSLSEKTGLTYATLRRKMRGSTPLRLEEALRIRNALGCQMPLETLFERTSVHEQ